MALRHVLHVFLLCTLLLSSALTEIKQVAGCPTGEHSDPEETTDTNAKLGITREQLPFYGVIRSGDNLSRDVKRENHTSSQRATNNIPDETPVTLNNTRDRALTRQVVHNRHTEHLSSRIGTGTPTKGLTSRPNDIGLNQLDSLRSSNSTMREISDSEETHSGIMHRQHVLTFTDNFCTTALPMSQYNMTLHDPVVLEFKINKDSEFILNNCSVLLSAPQDTVISVILFAMSCSVQGYVQVTDSFNHRASWKSCVRHINPGVDWMSEGNTALFRLRNSGDGLFTARMNAMAVIKPEPGTIFTRYLTSTLGYIQNAGIHLNFLASPWDGPAKTNTWSHLAVSGHNVVMISVPIAGLGSLTRAKACQHRVELYEGSMNQTVWRLCSRYRSLPQPHISYQRDVHVHFVSEQHDDELLRGIGFRLIYTFHDKSSIPVYLTKGKWNCSIPTWLSFHQHFICDLVIHCAGGEDERDCPVYTHCGYNGALLHGKCYSLIKLDPGATWHQANAVCSGLGSGGRLAPLLRDIFIWSLHRLRHDLTVYSGHILLAGLSSAIVESHL